MTASSTSITALSGRSNVATPHALVDGEVRALPWRNVDNIGPAGSINSTARDLVAWLRLHLGRGVYRGNRILSARAAEELRTPQIVLPPSRMGSMNAITKAGAASQFFSYALGWVVFDYRGRRVMWHGGNIDGMAAVVAMLPDDDLGLAVLTNLDGNTLRDAIMLRVFDNYLGAPERDWSRALLAVARSERPRPRSVAAGASAAARDLAVYQGRYHEPLLGGLTIRPEGARLSFALETGLTGTLEPLGGDRFRATWDDPAVPIVLSGLTGTSLSFLFEGEHSARWADFEGVGRFVRVP
jgi:hypothetical protein